MSQEDAPTARRSFPVAFIRTLFLWVLLPLCLLVGAGAGGLYALCAFRPDIVTNFVEGELIAATDMPWRIGGELRPVFSPHFGFSMRDVTLLAATVEQSEFLGDAPPLISIEKLTVYVDMDSVPELSPRLHLMELDSPVVSFAYDSQQRPLWVPLEQAAKAPEHMRLVVPKEKQEGGEAAEESSGASAQPAAGGAETSRLAAMQASVAPALAAPADAAPVAASGSQNTAQTGTAPSSGVQAEEDPFKSIADTMCTLPPAVLQPLIIKTGSLVSYDKTGKKLLSFSGFDGSFDPQAAENNLILSSSFDLPDADLKATFSIKARVGCEGIPARGRLKGRVEMTPPGSRTLVANVRSHFLWEANGRTLLLPNFSVAAEGDSLKGSLVADLSVPQCTGKVAIDRVSLTRWFEFGRAVPPGLKEVLHTVSGTFDLVLDSGRAEARNLKGTAGNLPVRGYVGTKSFSRPVVEVDLDVAKGDMDKVFPFLAPPGQYVPDPNPPSFDHPPLAPYPQDPKAKKRKRRPGDPPDIDVSYDVAVRVAKPRVHGVEAGPVAVTVLPVTVGGASKTRVAIRAPSIIKGAVDGHLDIDKNGIQMHYDAKGLELKLLPENSGNPVQVAGRVTGICDIDMPFKSNGSPKDDWPIRVNAAISNFEVSGQHGTGPWRVQAGQAKLKGAGSIYTVLTKGARFEGTWDIDASGAKSSWYPKGKESFSGVFKGGLFWPPIPERPHGARPDPRQRRSVEFLRGTVTVGGSFFAPIGPISAPVRGKLSSELDWRFFSNGVRFSKLRFEGLGGFVEGGIAIDYSAKDVAIAADAAFSLNPHELLKEWKLLPSSGIQVPKVFRGRALVKGSPEGVRFEKIKGGLDGSDISGDVFWTASPLAKKTGQKTPQALPQGLWTFKLASEQLDLDNYFPPSQPLPKGKRPPLPSKKRWDLSALKGLAIDAQLSIRRLKKDKLRFFRTTVTATLRRDRFSVHAQSDGFYKGTATAILQGTVVPEASTVVLRKCLGRVQGADLGRILRDYTQDTAYGGTTNLIFDLSGRLKRDADIPANLSGIWKLDIKDGIYPGFLTGEKSTLRNTFSLASASGEMEAGVLRSKNFLLTGPMVDMRGGGWLSANPDRGYDLSVSATFALVPTVPIHFFGSLYDPKMEVRGMNMVLETVQNAGTTIFGLIKGILTLPAHAVRGVESAVGSISPPTIDPVSAPYSNETGHPGQSGAQ